MKHGVYYIWLLSCMVTFTQTTKYYVTEGDSFTCGLEKNDIWLETIQWHLITANGTTITIANCNKSKTCVVIYNQRNFYASSRETGIEGLFHTPNWSITLKVVYITRDMQQLKCSYGFFQFASSDDCKCSFDFGDESELVLKLAIPLGIGAFILILVVVCCMCRRCRRKKSQSEQTHHNTIFTVQREGHSGNQTIGSPNTDTSPCVPHLATRTHTRHTTSRQNVSDLNQRGRQQSLTLPDEAPPSYSSLFTSDVFPMRHTHNVQPLRTTFPQYVHPRLIISLDNAQMCHMTTDTNDNLRMVCPTCQLPVQTRELQLRANTAM